MVNVVSAVSAAQNPSLNTGVQNSAPATPAPPPPLSSINFVVSGIYMNNLQKVAILEYRSCQTGQVLQQYPNQAQINAFKAAQQLAEQASTKQQAEVAARQQAAAAVVTTDSHETDTTDHVSVPATTNETAGSSDAATAGAGSSDGNTTTSVVV